MSRKIHYSLIAVLSVYLLLVGCPHRTPVWSPGGKKVLLLGGADREALDKPASRLWLIDLEAASGSAGQKSMALLPPESARDCRFLAAAWIDERSFAVITARWEGGEAVDGTEMLWKVSENGAVWTRLDAPPASGERTPRRNPVVVQGKNGKVILYATASEAVTAVSLDGKVVFKVEPAEIVGPGPQDGFLIYRPEEGETGDLELVALGSDQKKLWSRRFSELRSDIAGSLGKKPEEIVFNDASSSVVDPEMKSVAVNLVFTDVNWKDGVSGYLAILAARDGALQSVSGATCLPGKPALTGDAKSGWWAWAVLPLPDKISKNTAIGSFPVAGASRGSGGSAAAGGARIELKDLPRSAIQGYGLSPDRQTFCVAVNGATTRLLFYQVSGGTVKGEPREIQLP
jgi:hypothetical protein